MPERGAAEVRIGLSDAGGTMREISRQVLTLNGLDVQAIMRSPTTGFSETWRAVLPTGVRMVADITIGGVYNDGAASLNEGVRTVIGEPAATVIEQPRTFALSLTGVDPTTVTPAPDRNSAPSTVPAGVRACACYVTSATDKPQQENTTEYEATLQVTGEVVTGS